MPRSASRKKWLRQLPSGGAIVKTCRYLSQRGDCATQKALEADDNLGTRIIDVAIKLDHGDDIPELELRRLHQRVRKNPFAFTVMRDLVADFLYLYRNDYPTIQMLGSMWNIKLTGTNYLANREKKE